MDDFKWFSIMVVGVALAGAIAFGVSSYANVPVATACVESGSSWVAGSAGSECRSKDYTPR